MTRPLSAVGIALVLFGVEIATGTVSLAVVRLWGGLGAILSGDEYVLSPARIVAGSSLLLVGFGLLATVVYVEVARTRVIQIGNACPECATETQRVRRRTRHRLLSQLLEAEVTRRRCPKCGWSGLTA